MFNIADALVEKVKQVCSLYAAALRGFCSLPPVFAWLVLGVEGLGVEGVGV
jgi:hypothetical protein